LVAVLTVAADATARYPEAAVSTPPPAAEQQALEAGLVRANVTLAQAAKQLAGRERLDYAGLPGGSLALLLAEGARKGTPPLLIITADQDSAFACAQDLAFFGVANEGEDALPVLRFPASDASPYLNVAPDRKSAMERVAALCHLGHGLPFHFLVAPVAALLRKVAPRKELTKRSRQIRLTDIVDRDELVALLAECGYLRVPVVEDPGSFAVRGSLIDVYPPHAQSPARIELDDELVASIKRFDPDTQRTLGELDHVFIHPARQALSDAGSKKRVRERVSDLCDEFDLPSRKRSELLDELDTGRSVLGGDALLPAYFGGLETLFDYLPETMRVVVVDPTQVLRAASEELERAHGDRAARVSDAPAYPVSSLYLSTHELGDLLAPHPVAVVHSLAVAGAPQDDESPLADLDTVKSEELLALGGEGHEGLLSLLKLQRKEGGRADALQPLAAALRGFLESGMRVLVTARTRTQADRIAGLLRGYGLELAGGAEPFRPERLRAPITGKIEVVLGELSHGFVLAPAGLVCVTEAEVFGARAPRSAGKKSRSKKTEAFLDDLSALSVGDFVVHTEHGIGRYLGLEKKQMPLSRYEELQGMKPVSVEVLLVEYLGGKLFLPVTRLNQIQKHSGVEGKAPKLDKLGGQTFARTKAKARDEVKQLADDLLKIYAQRAAVTRPPLDPADRTYAEFEAGFPFDETPDQTRAIDDVLSDLTQKRAMDRVVCGDVGFGKTEVAMRAAFRVAMSGRQVAVLCPTTVLAQQHTHTFRERMSDYPLRIAQLSRFVNKEDSAATLALLKEGRVDILIGTHRLLSKDVHFKNLGLLVVDEEQRFGVQHKERIKSLKSQVDVLTLSATPIPRTLQMAITGLRDLSIIGTPPVDRRAVRTFVTRWDPQVLREAMRRELSRGGQAFFVHNRIESLAERGARLQELVPEARIAMAHGQMNEATLERVMSDFVEGRYDILCSTAIIESGLDIPRANTMIIDRADHYGLAQLYQLRGRVGRSKERAYCYLVAPPPSAMTDEARLRIAALERFTELGSGFKVASLDLELRGAGDVLGAEQSGTVSAVGFELFLKMLEEAVAELRGETVAHEIDPEVSVDTPLLLPDDYIDDIGVRLSFYKRFAGADSESDVEATAEEMEDRFGPAPDTARTFVRAMALKPELRRLRVLGCEATRARVTLHLSDDAPIDVARLVVMVAQSKGTLKLTPDRKLSQKCDENSEGDAIDRVSAFLRTLEPIRI
jgi:transcription-repair coupling factor (superfamily II helicase)